MCIVSFLHGAHAQACGDYVGNQGFSGVGISRLDLFAATDDQLYVSYVEGSTSAVTVEAYDGSSWAAVGPRASVPVVDDNANLPSFSFDGDFLNLAVADAGAGGDLTVYYYDGAEWIPDGGRGLTGQAVLDPAIAPIRPGVNVVVTGLAGGGGRGFLYDDTVFRYFAIGDTLAPGNPTRDYSVAVDPANGDIYVGFLEERDIDTWVARVLVYDDMADAWIDLSPPLGDFIARSVSATDLKISAVDGLVFAAFPDIQFGDRLSVGVYADNEWFFVGDRGFSEAIALDADIAFRDDRLYVGYIDLLDDGPIAQARYFDGNRWGEACPGATELGSGFWGALAATDENVFVGFAESPNGFASVVSVTIEVNVDAVVEAPDGTTLGCVSELFLDASFSTGAPDLDYFWSTGDSTSFIFVTAPGTYTVTVVDPVSGASDFLDVVVTDEPFFAGIDASALALTDAAPTVTLDAFGVGAPPDAALDFLWSTGSQDAQIVVNDPGTYEVTVRAFDVDDPNDPIFLCEATEAVTITDQRGGGGTSWCGDPLGAAGFTGPLSFTSLDATTDDEGRPLVLTQEGDTARLTVRRHDLDDGWRVVGPAQFGRVFGPPLFPSLAAGGGRVAVAFEEDDGFTFTQRVVELVDNDWVDLGDPGASSGRSGRVELGFLLDGRLVAAYATDSGRIVVDVYDDATGSWGRLGGQAFVVEAGLGGDFVLATDQTTGDLYLAHTAFGDPGPRRWFAHRYDGSSWQLLGAPQTRYEVFPQADIPLAFAVRDGRAVVAYADDTRAGATAVVEYDGSAWNELGGGPASADETIATDIALAGDALFVAVTGVADPVGNPESTRPALITFIDGFWERLCEGPPSDDFVAFVALAATPDSLYFGAVDATQDGGITVFPLSGANPTSVAVTIGVAGGSPPTLNCLRDELTLTASAAGGTGALNYLWSTGATDASILVDAAGTYSVTVTDSVGQSTTASVVIDEDFTEPTALIATPDGTELGCDVSAVLLDGSDSDGRAPVTYTWNDGSADPVLEATSPGIYRLVVTDGVSGCTDTAEVEVRIAVGSSLAGRFLVNGSVCVGDTVQYIEFSGTDMPEQLAFQWDFGDGATSTERDPRHRYGAAGAYVVALTVNDPACGVVTITKVVDVVDCRRAAPAFATEVDVNPTLSDGRVRAEVRLPASAPLTLGIFDASGRQLAERDFGEVARIREELVLPADGVLFLRFASRYGVTTVPVVVRR